MKKVLIIEDARADRRMFRRLLEKKDIKIIFAWDAEKKSVSIDIERKEVSINYEMYLFSRDSVPGSDKEKLTKVLTKVLKEDFDIDWAEGSKIRKSEDRTICISKDENSAVIMIDEEEEKATLKISDGRTYDLKVKSEKGKLNIYKELEKKISKYDLNFIDLAWTKDEEDTAGKLRRLEFSEMKKREEEFKKSIKGLALLDSLRDEKIKKIVTTSFYSVDIAKFCRHLGAEQVFHKWADENKINQFLVGEEQ